MGHSWLFLLVIMYLTLDIGLATDPYEGHSLACLLSCNGHQGNDTMTHTEMCDFLLSESYNLCTSYDIATARCKPNSPCKTDCGITDWCYFGVGMIANCQANAWHSFGDGALTLQSDCIRTESKAADGSGKDHHKLTRSERFRIIAVIAMVAFLAGGMSLLLLYWFSSCICLGGRNSHGPFMRVPMTEMADQSFDMSSDMSSASSMLSMDGDGRRKKSFYREKFSQWTGARRKKDVDSQYEMTLSRSVQENQSDDIPMANRALTEAHNSHL